MANQTSVPIGAKPRLTHKVTVGIRMKKRVIVLVSVLAAVVLMGVIAASAVVMNKPEVATGRFWREWNHDRRVAALKKQHRSQVLPLYEKINIGMSRAEVERLLGKPTAPELEGDPHAWYLQSPPHYYAESPYGLGTVCVTYANGKVKSKELNPQL